jgi:hypothetical protein
MNVMTMPSAMHRLSFAALFVVSCSAALADDFARPIVDKLDTLIETARAHGEAHGILGGDAAAQLHKLGVDSPMLVDVTTLAKLAQPDCRRLRVAISQKDVQMPGWKEPHDRHTQFEMNYCPGGKSPSSAANAKVLP